MSYASAEVAFYPYRFHYITLHYIIKLFIVAKVKKTARSTMAQVTQQCYKIKCNYAKHHRMLGKAHIALSDCTKCLELGGPPLVELSGPIAAITVALAL